jgi:signal transduction histidine kinase
MNFFLRLKFSTKIILGILGIMVFMALVLTPSVSRMAASALVKESKKRGLALVGGLAIRAVDPMLTMDLLRLRNIVDDEKNMGGDIVYAFILDAKKQVLVHTFQKGFPIDLIAANNIENTTTSRIQLLDAGTELIYDFAAPVVIGDSQMGTGRIGLSRSIIQRSVNRLILTIAALSAVTFFLAILLGALFARCVTSRLGLLKKHVEEMVMGNLDHQTGPLLKRNCWEIMNCDLKKCPAYGDSRRRCWYVAGTMCAQCDHSRYPQKMQSCQICPIYKENVGDEIQDLAETFDVMALSLKTRISEIKNYQEQLLHSQKMDSIGKMAAGIAHEINTPLGIILGYAQFLQDDVNPEDEMMEELQAIERQAKVCRKIVADLLKFSRQTETTKSEMSINNSLLETIALVEHSFSLDKVLIQTDLEEEEKNIVGDPDKLKQVWLNLFNNARDAMPDGGLILVRSGMNAEKNLVVISVADTGPGISEKNMKKIFDPFFTTKPIGKGTGLGLSVSFGIIEDHCGRIRAQSPLPIDLKMEDVTDSRPKGPGTVFMVEIPVAPLVSAD